MFRYAVLFLPWWFYMRADLSYDEVAEKWLFFYFSLLPLLLETRHFLINLKNRNSKSTKP